ncbi:MAG: hypothetical protein KJ896_01580, partial [Nanoarchaeota archaeon]|nr:hypothetical protein [Nanoarchaeota archaeon]
MNSKVLVIAGTHTRENEYSHAVADRLVAHYAAGACDQRFYGIDGAREGELWHLDEQLAVAKIHKVGHSSKEYLRTLEKDELVELADFALRHRKSRTPPGVDSRVGMRGHWTTIHDNLLAATNPSLYIDLHSFHEGSDSDGIGLYIKPHIEVGKDESSPKLESLRAALHNAKKDLPDFFGDHSEDYESGHLNRMLGGHDISILHNKIYQLGYNLERFRFRLRGRLPEGEKSLGTILMRAALIRGPLV